MSLKNVAFAFTAVLVLSGSAFAGDLIEDLKTTDLASITDAGAELETPDLDGLNLDQLAKDAGSETDAVEACFNHLGGYGGGYGGWNNWCGYQSFGHCYTSFYTHCYRPVVCYQPIVTTYTHYLPVVSSYWGCY